jgi:hypothetical protein
MKTSSALNGPSFSHATFTWPRNLVRIPNRCRRRLTLYHVFPWQPNAQDSGGRLSRWFEDGEKTSSHGGIARGEALSYERVKKHVWTRNSGSERRQGPVLHCIEMCG